MKSRKDFTVFEYGHLISDKDSGRINNAVSLPPQLFEWLEQRCLKDDADNTHRLLTLGSRGGVKTLQVKTMLVLSLFRGMRLLKCCQKRGGVMRTLILHVSSF